MLAWREDLFMFCFLILFFFPVFTSYSILFPLYSRRDVESPLGISAFKDKSGKIKGNRPLPSKWSLTVASANVADWLHREKLWWFARFCRQIGYVGLVRHRFFAWQTLPPADGIRISFLPNMHQNHTEDACDQSKLSWFWSVCTTACFSYTLKTVIPVSVSYKIIGKKRL